MTKQQEIEVFSAFANSYPSNSYLKEWLMLCAPIVERDIRSDLTPMTYWPGEHYQQVVEKAEREAKRIIREAQQQADKMMADARKEIERAERVRQSAIYALNRAAKDLE
jgi:hypothetical protein